MRIKHLFISLLFIGMVHAAQAQVSFYDLLAVSALELTKDKVKYDPAYYSIPYPNGDVPDGLGVCTDVVIRAYRKRKIDLQQLVHQDMRDHFHLYPKKWALKNPDTNIDHRRVPNLMVFFARHGEELAISKNGSDYKPGDIVCWYLSGTVTHIGLVSNVKSDDGTRYKIVHNIGAGQLLIDCLFDYRIIGHYRYGEAK